MDITEMIALLGVFVVLPIIIVALVARAKTNATNKRAEIALANMVSTNLSYTIQNMKKDSSIVSSPSF